MSAATSALRARRTNGLPTMPTTRTGFDVAAAWTLWTMSALRLATRSRIAGCKRASSRIVRDMDGSGGLRQARPYHRRVGDRRRGGLPAHARAAGSGRERAALKVADRALQLRNRVHHERAVLRDRLAERPTRDEKNARWRGRARRGREPDPGGARLVAENRHALGIDPGRPIAADVDRTHRDVGEGVVAGGQLRLKRRARGQADVEDHR